MNREVHVRFCGNIGVKLPGVTRLVATLLEHSLQYSQMVRWTLLPLLLFFADRAFSQKRIVFSDKSFIYTLRVDSTLSADSVNYFCTVKSISISRRQDNRQIQVIYPEENSPGCTLPKEQIFIVEDINFDGYNDIRLLQFLPAAPNLPYYFWTYNPGTKQFNRQTALEDISSPEFDQTKKIIYSFWRASCCNHGFSTYKYVNGKPTLIDETEIKEEDGKTITTVKRRVNGRMKLVSKKIEQTEEH